MKTTPIYTRVEIRKSDVDQSCRSEVRRIHRSNGVEWVWWNNERREIYVDAANDVYYLLLGKWVEKRGKVMHKPTHTEREDFVAKMVKLADASSWYCQKIMRYARAYGALQETKTVRPLDEREKNKERRMQEDLVRLCADLKCTPLFFEGTRTYTVKIQVPGGTEIGVPTSF
jgi:hypothetical protein